MKMDETLYSLFDATEETHWWFVARRKIVLEMLRSILPPGAPRILDVGCGTGSTLKELEKMGEAVGADISEEAIAYCRRRGCGDVRLVAEDELSFRDGEFDAVLSLDVLEHIENEGAALAEYRRVLKPGGVLLLTAPAYAWLWSAHDDVNHHRRRYTRGSLEQLLAQSGWGIERLSYFCTLLFPLVAAIRMGFKLFHRSGRGLEFKIPGPHVNRVCQTIFASEAAWLTRRDFPFGSSLMVVCRRQKTVSSKQ
jgi:SAM-dependent methyltransferase